MTLQQRAAPAAPARDELESFCRDLEAASLHALWNITKDLLPPTPRPRAIPWLWPARTMRPLAERAIRLVPVERGGVVIPSWAPVEHLAGTPADLFTLSDTPVLRALGIHREEALGAPQTVTSVFDAGADPRR